MDTEYEATFINVDKNQIRAKLEEVGAKLIRPEFLQKRYALELPKGHEIRGGWIRVRDEGDKITLSLKIIDGDKIHDQKELQIVVDSFEETRKLLTLLGCTDKAYQETKREIWESDEVEIMIDEWPFLEPFIEVEGPSEEKVREVSGKLGFDWKEAEFCAVGVLYEEKYGVPKRVVNTTAKLVFDMENPFS